MIFCVVINDSMGSTVMIGCETCVFDTRKYIGRRPLAGREVGAIGNAPRRSG